MVAILMNWLVDVLREFRVPDPTLYSTNEIIMKILDLVPVERNRLQLLGVAALFLACKYCHDGQQISAKELVDLTDDTYSQLEV